MVLIETEYLAYVPLHGLIQLPKRIQFPVNHIGPVAPLVPIHLEIGRNLFERQFKGITDIVEQSGHSPEFQKMAGFLPIITDPPFRVKLPVSIPELGTGHENTQSKAEDIDRMGVMVPVLHQQTAAIRLILGQQFDHPARFLVIADKHLQIAEIHVECVFFLSAVQKPDQGFFHAEPVYVHLHIIRDLPFLKTCPQIDPFLLLLLLHRRIKAEILAILPDKFLYGPLQGTGSSRITGIG